MYAVSVATASSTTTASSSSSPLSVSISASPSSGNAPLSTSFTSIVSGGTAPYTYSWSFGDGTSSTSASPAHTYQNAGTYLAELKVTDSTGATATASYSVVANSLSTSTTSYYTTTQTTDTTSTGVTTVHRVPRLSRARIRRRYTTAQCLILNAVNGCHLPNTPPGLPIAMGNVKHEYSGNVCDRSIDLSSGLTVSEIIPPIRYPTLPITPTPSKSSSRLRDLFRFPCRFLRNRHRSGLIRHRSPHGTTQTASLPSAPTLLQSRYSSGLLHPIR